MSAWRNKSLIIPIYGSAGFSLIVVLLMGTVMLTESWTALTVLGWEIFGSEWHPAQGKYGILPMIHGTLAVTAIVLLLAIPLGLLTAFSPLRSFRTVYALMLAPFWRSWPASPRSCSG